MNPTPPIKIPVDFINEVPHEQLAVDEEGLWKLLGLNDGKRTVRAMKDASYRFRAIGGVRTLPGGLFPISDIQRALSKCGAEK